MENPANRPPEHLPETIQRILNFWIQRAALMVVVFSSTIVLGISTNESNAQTWIQRAKNAMGVERAGQKILHFRAAWADQQNYQSDRSYPPFFDAISAAEVWYQPSTGVEHVKQQLTFPGIEQPLENLYDSNRGVMLRGDRAVPLARSQLRIRNLNPWAVIYDWEHAENVSVEGESVYRDYPRIVLARKTEGGEQRLFLDGKTGFPVKLDYIEFHYLWGHRHIEYVYSNWVMAGKIEVSASAFLLADGAVEISTTTGTTELIDATGAPSMAMPAPVSPANDLPAFLQPRQPQVTKVGSGTYLLTNPGYTEAVTLSGDQLYIFDATQGAERARLDEEAIAKLFPGKHKINVVVTDLAWPHIAGVRYWVAQGATIIAHKAAKPFLETVINRRWTLQPDLLEQRRATTSLHFQGIEQIYKSPDGAVTLLPIDGIGSEVVLAAYLAPDHFLWASDYIQTVDEPTAYAAEVWNAVQRAHLQPQQVAAEHLPLTAWKVVDDLNSAAK